MTKEQQNRLRSLRAWHYAQAVDYRERASVLEKKALTFDRASRETFSKTAGQFHTKANEHIRFVQTLNDFFDPNDRVM